MKIYRKYLERYNPDKKDIQDNRKKISFAVFSYYSETGEEYRKSFKATKNTPENYFWDIAPKVMEI